ncbi:zinc knuckle CX2CX4HX4C containing protein [Tanacetum coccineum]
MDKGFLNRKSKDKNHVSDGSKSTGLLVSDLTIEIKSINGKILGKDGEPTMAQRCVRFSDTNKKETWDGTQVANIGDMETVAPMTNIHTSHVSTVSNMDVHSVYQNETKSHTDCADITDQNTTSAVSLPKDAVDEIRARFVNTLYGYFVGKRLAFPMVENYVKHAWEKFGLKRVMLNHGFFLFQFDSSTVMEKGMEGSPWRIKLVPIILKVWMPNTILKRENVSIVPLWVKMHNVPIVAYSKVGLDLISAKVGRLIRLDAHTNSICCNSWGRSDYARALVEVSAEAPLVDSVDVVIPLDDGVGHVMVNIGIEYEWQPPRCGTCKNFEHLEAMCPMKLMECPKKKCVNEAELSKGNGPVRVTGRKNKGKQVGNQRQIHGIRFTKPKTKLVYRVVEKSESDKHVKDNMGMSSSDTTKTDTPPDSSRKVYHDDNINIDELRAFVVNKMEEEKIVYRSNAVNTCFIGCEYSLFIEVMQYILILSDVSLGKSDEQQEEQDADKEEGNNINKKKRKLKQVDATVIIDEEVDKQKRRKNLKNTKTKAYKKKKRKGKKAELVENEMVEAEMVESDKVKSESNEEPPLRKKKLDAPSFVDVRKLKGDTLVLKGAETEGKKDKDEGVLMVVEKGKEVVLNEKVKCDPVNILTRMSPSHLMNVLDSLTTQQVSVLEELGLGEYHNNFNFTSTLGALGMWLVKNYDHEEHTIKMVDGRKIKVTRELIHEILGVPMGEIKVNASKHQRDMKDCLSDNLSKIKALLLDTNDKIKIALDENLEDSDLKMILGNRLAFFKELNHCDDDNAMVVLDNCNDVPEESVKDNEVSKEKDDVTEKQKDVEKIFELGGKNTVQVTLYFCFTF